MSSANFANPEKPEGSAVDGPESSGAAPPAGVPDEPAVSRLFPTVYLATFLGVILIALAINVLGDGTSLLPSPGFPSDSDRAWKARRLEALARSGSPPQSIILGSSRVTGFEPKYIEEVTGLRCFNDGVSVGCPVDYLAQFRFLLSLGIKPELLIIGVDEFAFGDHPENDTYDLQLLSHPALFRHVPTFDQLWIGWRALKAITLQSTRKSLANLRNKSWDARPAAEEDDPKSYADGLSKFFAQGHYGPRLRELLDAGIEEKVISIKPFLDRPSKVERMRPQPRQVGYFRELMAITKEQEVKVYVALLPVQPEYARRVLTPRLREIRLELSELLRDTCHEFGAVYRDLTSLESFGGHADDFVDGTHLTTRNTRRMIDVLLRRGPDQATIPRARQALPSRTSIIVAGRS